MEAEAVSSGLQWNGVGVGYGFPRPETGSISHFCEKDSIFQAEH